MKKILCYLGVLSFAATLLFPQSLVEAAKKEQERREQYKGKKARVVTNADLKNIGKKAAVAAAASPAAKPAGSEEAGEAAVEEEPAFPRPIEETEEGEPREFASSFAFAVLPDTMQVEDPDSALFEPDGRYADITFLGFLDLEFRAKNGRGDDIAIYARQAGVRGLRGELPTEEGIPSLLELNYFPEGLHYGVMVMREGGVEWEDVGIGTGASSPETFDLGEIPSVIRIRIVFRPPYTNVTAEYKPYQLGSKELSMGIDAVGALN